MKPMKCTLISVRRHNNKPLRERRKRVSRIKAALGTIMVLAIIAVIGVLNAVEMGTLGTVIGAWLASVGIVAAAGCVFAMKAIDGIIDRYNARRDIERRWTA